MQQQPFKRQLWIFACLALCLLVSCSPAAAPAPVEEEPTSAPATATPAPTQTRVMPTETAVPTETEAPPAATVEPTATPVPALALADDGFQAWCSPQTAQAADLDPWVMPADGAAVTEGEDGLVLTYPALTCTFAFTFNQAAPEGLTLAVYETASNSPTKWLTSPLTIAEGQPNTAYAILKHTYIVNPPLWSVRYRFRLADAGDQEYWNEEILLKRSWDGKMCWNGRMQNPVTLTCDKITWGDRHPTDWGYYLPSPTPGGSEGAGVYAPGE